MTGSNVAPATNAVAPRATLAPPSASNHTSGATHATNASDGCPIARPNTRRGWKKGRTRLKDIFIKERRRGAAPHLLHRGQEARLSALDELRADPQLLWPLTPPARAPFRLRGSSSWRHLPPRARLSRLPACACVAKMRRRRCSSQRSLRPSPSSRPRSGARRRSSPPPSSSPRSRRRSRRQSPPSAARRRSPPWHPSMTWTST